MMSNTNDRAARSLLGECDHIDFNNPSSILVGLFEGVIQPDVCLTHENMVSIQSPVSVKVCT